MNAAIMVLNPTNPVRISVMIKPGSMNISDFGMSTNNAPTTVPAPFPPLN